MFHSLSRCLAAAAILCLVAACARQSGADLPRLEIDPARVAVAGLSSGAYMATQSHLAWPEVFSGAALVAGGPWGCAEGELSRALSTCIEGEPPPDVPALVATARARAAAGQIGRLEDLAGDRVFILHGQLDQTVAPAVGRAAAAFYEQLGAALPEPASLRVTWDGDHPFGHNLPVAAAGDDCAASEPPFLGHCGFDAAGVIFAQLFGAARAAPAEPTGELLGFDQDALRDGAADPHLAHAGYLYLPAACRAGERCGLLVVFHGCQQNADSVGEAFVREAGFNRWADAYEVAVLYPQTRASFLPLNPRACWDWWGYSGADYDTREGAQQRWLRKALDALGVPSARS